MLADKGRVVSTLTEHPMEKNESHMGSRKFVTLIFDGIFTWVFIKCHEEP